MKWTEMRGLLAIGALLLVAGCHGGSSDGSSGAGGPSLRERIAAAMQEPNPESRANTLCDLALQQHRANDLTGAEQTFSAAARACADVQDAAARASTLTHLAEAQAQADGKADARRSVAEALRAADGIDNAEPRGAALVRIAVVQGKRLRDAAAAAESFAMAAALVDKVADAEGKAALWLAAAQGHQDLGAKADAATALVAARTVADQVPDPFRRSAVIAKVAGLQAAVAPAEVALASFEAALSAARQVPSAYSKAFALVDAGKGLTDAGQTAKARQVLQEARAAAASVPQPDSRREATDKVEALAKQLPAT